MEPMVGPAKIVYPDLQLRSLVQAGLRLLIQAVLIALLDSLDQKLHIFYDIIHKHTPYSIVTLP